MPQPARPMTIYFEVDLNESGEAFRTIDISQCVSMLSRKRYRQGLEWAVSGIRVNSPQAIGITVATLPQTWSCAQAWKTGFRAWRKMNAEAERDMTVDNEARYMDYKIFFDKNHSDSGEPQWAPNLLPYGASPAAPAAVYDWNYSEYHWPDDSDMAGATRLVHMIGDDQGAVSIGLIHNYANLRARPMVDDPNVPELGSGSVFTSLFDDGGDSDAVLVDISQMNDDPPYYTGIDPTEEEYYPGGKNYRNDWYSWQISVTNVYNSGSGNSGNGFIPGFTAYAGLVRLYLYSGAGSVVQNIGLYLDLLPGPHDGYMARPMQEVN